MSGGYHFKRGFSDGAPQINTLARAAQLYAMLAPLGMDYMRLNVPWNYVASTQLPGPWRVAGAARATGIAVGSAMVGTGPRGGGTAYGLAQGTAAVFGSPPQQQGRDWSLVDRCLCDVMLTMGCDVMLMIGQDRPTWGGGWFGLGGVSGNAVDYGHFCAEVAQRYRPGGVGIRTDGKYAALAGRGVTIYELWNEPNSEETWATPINATDYTQFVINGYAGIKSVLPGGFIDDGAAVATGSATGTAAVGTSTITTQRGVAIAQGMAQGSARVTNPGPRYDTAQSTVLWAGMVHVQYVDNGNYQGYGSTHIDEVHFLAACYAAANTLGTRLGYHFDKMATHVYTQSDTVAVPDAVAGTTLGPAPALTTDNFRQLQAIHDMMQANNDGAKGIWVTETGLCVYNNALGADLQATYMKQAFDNLDTLPYVDAVIIYSAIDYSAGTTNDGYTGFGAIDYNFNPRALYKWLASSAHQMAGSLTITGTALGAAAIGASGAATATAVAQVAVQGPPSGVASATASATGVAAVGRGASAAATAAGVATGAAASKLSASYAFTGSTKPTSQFTEWGTAAGVDYAVASGVAAISAGPPVGAGLYMVGGIWVAPFATQLHHVEITFATNGNSFDRGDGVIVGANAAGTSGVIAIGRNFPSSTATQFYTLIGGALTALTTGSTVGSTTWNANDALKVVITESAGIYTYTVFKNGVSTGVSWTDVAGVFTPGNYGGFACQGVTSGGVNYTDAGIKGSWVGADN